jgi:hypothetical protein
MVAEYYQCPKCKSRFRIVRKNRQRKMGHVKYLWCAMCKDYTPHKRIG